MKSIRKQNVNYGKIYVAVTKKENTQAVQYTKPFTFCVLKKQFSSKPLP